MVEGRVPTLPSRLAVAALSLALGGVMLALALPRIAAELAALPGNRIEAAVEHGQLPGDAELALLVQSREGSLAWLVSGRTEMELAVAELLLARDDLGGGEWNRSRRAQAEAMFRAGLARAPADPYGWARLAHLSLIEGASPRQVVPLLEMSLRTAPVEPPLTLARLELCLVEWNYFDASAAPQLEAQLRLAWAEAPDALVRLVRATGRVDLLQSALPQDKQAALQRRLAASP